MDGHKNITLMIIQAYTMDSCSLAPPDNRNKAVYLWGLREDAGNMVWQFV